MVNISITAEVDLEAIVYLKTDKEQTPYMVTGICRYADGSVGYRLTTGNRVPDWFMAVEFSTVKNMEFV